MKLLIFLLLLINFSVAEHRPKRYTVNLDDAPDQRWNQIIRDHLDSLPELAKQARSIIPAPFQPFVWWFASQISRLLPQEYAEEMEGIARESGLPVGEIVGLNILYDITAFDRGHFLYEGCTSIIAEDEYGRIWHGRNMDYEMQPLLKNITILVDFKRGNETVYSGTTFAFYNGILTGQRPNSFTLSLNERYAGGYIDTIIMEFYTHFKRPVSLFLREVLETTKTYEKALDVLSNTPLIAPSYIIVGGTKSGQGAVISRSRMKAADVYTLDKSSSRWFLVETNFDRWKRDEDDRRITAIRLLNETGQAGLDDKSLMAVLKAEPVLNDLTIYSVLMSARYPRLLSKSLIVYD